MLAYFSFPLGNVYPFTLTIVALERSTYFSFSIVSSSSVLIITPPFLSPSSPFSGGAGITGIGKFLTSGEFLKISMALFLSSSVREVGSGIEIFIILASFVSTVISFPLTVTVTILPSTIISSSSTVTCISFAITSFAICFALVTLLPGRTVDRIRATTTMLVTTANASTLLFIIIILLSWIILGKEFLTFLINLSSA